MWAPSYYKHCYICSDASKGSSGSSYTIHPRTAIGASTATECSISSCTAGQYLDAGTCTPRLDGFSGTAVNSIKGISDCKRCPFSGRCKVGGHCAAGAEGLSCAECSDRVADKSCPAGVPRSNGAAKADPNGDFCGGNILAVANCLAGLKPFAKNTVFSDCGGRTDSICASKNCDSRIAAWRTGNYYELNGRCASCACKVGSWLCEFLE